MTELISVSADDHISVSALYTAGFHIALLTGVDQ